VTYQAEIAPQEGTEEKEDREQQQKEEEER